jgi:FkbM family methyltransferase
MMKITKEGWAIIEGDTHIGPWIEQTGEIDHGQKYAERFTEFGLRPGDTAIDIGALVGDTAIPMADVVGRGGKVFAFEPNPEAFACLVYNTRFHRQVKCLPYALGNDHTLAAIRTTPNVGASHINRDQLINKACLVPMTTLDVLELSYIRFIKIDVEGYELEVIAGAQQTIERYRPSMMIETAVHGEKFKVNHRRALYNWLEERDYKVAPHFLSLEEAPQYDIFAEPKLFELTTEPPKCTT